MATASDVNAFPALRPGVTPGPKPQVPRRATGVRLDLEEEAALFGITPDEDGVRYGIEADPFMYRSDAEIDADWREWDEYQAAMSRWIDGRGPRPE